ncbi:unnamed protein product [Symbiodinium natans]|uniref:Uncharacterized protein n=1 Tax=Symbiodinium natans TaxID=878477 RepID=A0A812UXX6_9DINO|nr:unnamed protein product [Symbiodinium natans]
MTIVELEGEESAVNADRDAALRELFGLDVSADALLQQELRALQARAPSRVVSPSPMAAGSTGDMPALFCPVPGCARAHGNGPAWVSIEDLPSLHDIFTSPIYTKEHLPAELWPLLREEYGKLLARVNCFAEMTAWDPLPTYAFGWGGQWVGQRREEADPSCLVGVAYVSEDSLATESPWSATGSSPLLHQIAFVTMAVGRTSQFVG